MNRVLNFEQATAEHRAARAMHDVEIARLRRRRREGTRRRAASALRRLARRIEPERSREPVRPRSARPELARPRA